MTPVVLPAALAYAAMGWHVFPTVPGGKAPLTKNGLLDATTNRAIIESWFLAHPEAGLGVSCEPSNIFIIDVDQTSYTPEQFLEEFNLPPTQVVHTPNGGFHLYYLGQGPSTVSKLAPKVDTRGVGGYVLAPPTPGYYIDEFRRMADAPVLSFDRRPEARTSQVNVDAILNGLSEGTRNDQLFRYACRLRAKRLNKEESLVLLLAIAERCEPPFPSDEIETIVERVWFTYGISRG